MSVSGQGRCEQAYSYFQKALVSIRRWLLTNKWGQIVLLGSAPLIATPDDFEIVRGRPKGIFARTMGWVTPALVSGGFFGWVGSKSITKILVQTVPHIPGLTHAEYWEHMNKSTFLGWLALSAIGFSSVYIIGLSSWCQHRLYSWLFPKFGLSVIVRHPQYFLLKAASIVIWFGLLMLFSAWFLPVPMTDSSARDLAYIDEHPWLLIVGGLVLGLMVRRHNRMREIAARQIYPSMAARFIVNVGTFVTPFALLFGLGLFLRFWI